MKVLQHTKLFIFFLLFSACRENPCWSFRSIDTHSFFDNPTKLCLHSKDPHSPLSIEMTQIENEIETFLSLKRFYFEKDAKLQIKINGDWFESDIIVHQGRMRMKLPKETTKKIIEALQEGNKVDILIDEFEETLEPESFSSAFSKLLQTP